MWLWHAGPAPLSPDELWRAYLARFDEEHAFKFAKGPLGLTAAKVRTPQQADRWVRLVMAAPPSCCSPARWPPTCAAPGRNGPTPPARCRPAGSAGGFQTSAGSWAPPPVSLNPPGPAPAGPKAPPPAPHPATRCPRKTGNKDETGTPADGQEVKT